MLSGSKVITSCFQIWQKLSTKVTAAFDSFWQKLLLKKSQPNFFWKLLFFGHLLLQKPCWQVLLGICDNHFLACLPFCRLYLFSQISSLIGVLCAKTLTSWTQNMKLWSVLFNSLLCPILSSFMWHWKNMSKCYFYVLWYSKMKYIKYSIRYATLG